MEFHGKLAYLLTKLLPKFNNNLSCFKMEYYTKSVTHFTKEPPPCILIIPTKIVDDLPWMGVTTLSLGL